MRAPVGGAQVGRAFTESDRSLPNADMSSLAVGELIEVTGFSSQFTDHYEIDIRGPEDLAQPVK